MSSCRPVTVDQGQEPVLAQDIINPSGHCTGGATVNQSQPDGMQTRARTFNSMGSLRSATTAAAAAVDNADLETPSNLESDGAEGSSCSYSSTCSSSEVDDEDDYGSRPAGRRRGLNSRAAAAGEPSEQSHAEAAHSFPRYVSCQTCFKLSGTYIRRFSAQLQDGQRLPVQVYVTPHAADWDEGLYMQQQQQTTRSSSTPAQQGSGPTSQAPTSEGAAAAAQGPFAAQVVRHRSNHQDTYYLAGLAGSMTASGVDLTPGAYDIVLQEQVSTTTIHLHLKPAAQRGPGHRGAGISSAGQGGGLQILPGSLLQYDCDKELKVYQQVMFVWHLDKRLVCSQLPGAVTPITLTLHINDPDSPGLETTVRMRRSKKGGYTVSAGSIKSGLTAYNGRRVVKVGLTPNAHLTLHLASAAPTPAAAVTPGTAAATTDAPAAAAAAGGNMAAATGAASPATAAAAASDAGDLATANMAAGTRALARSRSERQQVNRDSTTPQARTARAARSARQPAAPTMQADEAAAAAIAAAGRVAAGAAQEVRPSSAAAAGPSSSSELGKIDRHPPQHTQPEGNTAAAARALGMRLRAAPAAAVGPAAVGPAAGLLSGGPGVSAAQGRPGLRGRTRAQQQLGNDTEAGQSMPELQDSGAARKEPLITSQQEQDAAIPPAAITAAAAAGAAPGAGGAIARKRRRRDHSTQQQQQQQQGERQDLSTRPVAAARSSQAPQAAAAAADAPGCVLGNPTAAAAATPSAPVAGPGQFMNKEVMDLTGEDDSPAAPAATPAPPASAPAVAVLGPGQFINEEVMDLTGEDDPPAAAAAAPPLAAAAAGAAAAASGGLPAGLRLQDVSDLSDMEDELLRLMKEGLMPLLPGQQYAAIMQQLSALFDAAGGAGSQSRADVDKLWRRLMWRRYAYLQAAVVGGRVSSVVAEVEALITVLRQ